MTRDLAIVFGGDERYALGLAVAVHSAITHLPAAVTPQIWILDNDLSQTSRARLEGVVRHAKRSDSLCWARIPADRLAHLGTVSHLTPASYSRLLVPDLVSPGVRRAIYLDADILVRSDLAPLFTVDLDGALAGAVRDFAIDNTAHEWSGVRGPERSGSRPYFNAGVLVMDVALWRRERMTERALQYAAAGAEPLRWADQDALNALVDRWHELDYRWNVQQRNLFLDEEVPRAPLAEHLRRQRRRLYRSAAVLHFVGPNPWDPLCPTAGAHAWVRAFARSRWFAPLETARWVVDWQRRRVRYQLGTRKQALFGRGG